MNRNRRNLKGRSIREHGAPAYIAPLDLWLFECGCPLCREALEAVKGRAFGSPGRVWKAFLLAEHLGPVEDCVELANRWLRHYRDAAATGWSPRILAEVKQQNELAWRWRFERGWWNPAPKRRAGKRRAGQKARSQLRADPFLTDSSRPS